MLILVILGTRSNPAIADQQGKVIDTVQKQLEIPSKPTWEQTIAPQLARRDQQIADAQAQAAAAAQAAADAARQAQLQAQQAQQQTITPVVSGSCSDWMSAAGITDQASAYALIMRESGCNPNSVNRSSGACGIGQQLPCGKWAHAWNDPVGGMIDMQAYVFGTYGSWANALAHSHAYNWY